MTNAEHIANWEQGLNKDNSWIPENRTDPTMEDTDGDGFSDGFEYYFWYQATVGWIDEKGKWKRLEGERFQLQDIAKGVQISPDEIVELFNPTVKATGDDRALVCFGGRFNGSTLTGGILAEDGAIVAATTSGLEGQTLTLQPGSRFRPYNTTTVMIGDLTFGEASATKAVVFDCSNSTTGYGVVVADTLSILSPVEFSVTPGWSVDSTLSSGTYTALVYQASCSVDPSLFRLPANAPAGATLSAKEVTLTAGDYAGSKALVVTIANDIVVTGSTSYPTPLTVSSDAAVGSIVVGGAWNGEADPVCETSLTISGNVTASEGLYLGYNPAPGVDKDNWHKGFLTLNGGEVDVKGVIDMSRNAQNPGNLAYNTKFGIWLNGGVLKAENITMTAASATTPQVVFNGGVYAPYGSKAANRTMECPNKVYVSAGGAVISTENIPAGETYVIAQPLLTDPALNGAADGGLVKRGAGTLALTGDNTFTGPLVVEEGVVALSGGATTLAQVSASGVIEGNLAVTNALVVGNAGSLLSVDGDVTLNARTAIDFGGVLVQGDVWQPVLAASGTLSVPNMIRARNCGDFNRCKTKVEGGVLYVCPTSLGTRVIIR